MKTIVCSKVGSMKHTDPAQRGEVDVMDLPEQPLGEEDVRIKVAYCAICGSDPHLVGGIFGLEPPFGLGHEMSGIITELGPKATRNGLKVGDRVAGNFLHFCGTCDYCRSGRQQFCTHADETNQPCMAESVVWHESQVYKLPDSVSLKEGCLLEPVSIIVRLMDKLEIKTGMTVAICGGGPIGLLAAQAVAKYGAASLTCIEPITERRELAKKMGALYTIDPVTENVQERCMEITGGLGYDIVVDCSGSVRATETLPPLVAMGGKLIYAAMYPNDYDLPLNLYTYLYRREITLTGMYVAPYAFPRALRLLPTMDLEDFTQCVYPIDRAKEAFAAHLTGKYPKVLIKCSDADD